MAEKFDADGAGSEDNTEKLFDHFVDQESGKG